VRLYELQGSFIAKCDDRMSNTSELERVRKQS